MWAAGQGNAGAEAMLIEFGADVHAKSKGGYTPLLFAVLNNRIDAAKTLLEHGANVEDQAPDGTTALNMAIVNRLLRSRLRAAGFQGQPECARSARLGAAYSGLAEQAGHFLGSGGPGAGSGTGPTADRQGDRAADRGEAAPEGRESQRSHHVAGDADDGRARHHPESSEH